MKYRLFLMLCASFILIAASVSACSLTVTLLNQDPYPAVPGDYVTAVFQIAGVEDPTCGVVRFELLQEFPFSLDPGVSPQQSIIGGTVVAGSSQYKKFFLAPYQIRVDEQAVDGDNKIKAIVTANNLADGRTNIQKEFNINVEAADTDFEVSIRDYNAQTNILTFEILNIGENDVEALTVDIPKQDNIEVKGSSRNIVGSLDSNEDTTFTFEATPTNGEIALDILYTDLINVRRSTTKTVTFDSSYFTGRAGDQQGSSPWFFVTLILVVGIIFFWWRGRRKRKRMKRN